MESIYQFPHEEWLKQEFGFFHVHDLKNYNLSNNLFEKGSSVGLVVLHHLKTSPAIYVFNMTKTR